VRILCLLIGFLFIWPIVPLPTSQAQEKTSDRRVVRRIEPEYPETLQRLYIGGVVRLKVTIAPSGNVEDVLLLGGNPTLGQSAMAAVRKWKYTPANSRTNAEIRLSFDPHR
jgi:TonB family protein